MKREQLEKLARAAIGIRVAFGGVRSMQITDGYLALHCETDEDAQEICGAYLSTVEHREDAREWWLVGRIRTDEMTITVFGPPHARAKSRELDDAKVDAAIAEAQAAIGGGS